MRRPQWLGLQGAFDYPWLQVAFGVAIALAAALGAYVLLALTRALLLIPDLVRMLEKGCS